MNLDARLRKLESQFCRGCGRPLRPRQAEGGLCVDITRLSVAQKRALFEALLADKCPNQMDLEKFKLLPVEEKINRLRNPAPDAW